MDFVLIGPEYDNLLGILSVVGCLRALDHVRPQWRPRVSWDRTSMQARLHVDVAVSDTAVAAAVDEGVVALGKHYDRLPGKDPKWDRGEWRAIIESGVDPEVMAAIGTELGGKSPLILVTGNSHLHFLSGLRALSAENPVLRVGRSQETAQIDSVQAIHAGLFGKWRRQDNGRKCALRWDHAEVRDHANRWRDPNKEPDMPIEFGAYRMAAVGWVVYCCGRSNGELRTAACVRNGRDWAIRWPIWSESLSWCMVRRLWVHPALVEERTLPANGTHAVMHACRLKNETTAMVFRANVVASAPVARQSAAPLASIEGQ